jgi:hypothetical protein
LRSARSTRTRHTRPQRCGGSVTRAEVSIARTHVAHARLQVAQEKFDAVRARIVERRATIRQAWPCRRKADRTAQPTPAAACAH